MPRRAERTFCASVSACSDCRSIADLRPEKTNLHLLLKYTSEPSGQSSPCLRGVFPIEWRPPRPVGTVSASRDRKWGLPLWTPASTISHV